MDLKKIVLIAIFIGTVYARSKNSTKLIRNLQKHVAGLENRQKHMKARNYRKFTDLRMRIAGLEYRQNEMKATQEMFVKKPPTNAHDCKELLDMGYSDDGEYTILVDRDAHMKVWCDMTNGGWIVFMKRYNGELAFNQNFQAYSQGFGNLTEEFWLGLNSVHLLTQTGQWTLRVDLESLKTESFKSKATVYADYSGFRIGAGTDFILYFDNDSYNGTAGDSLWSNGGMKFSTYDMDQDTRNHGSCSQEYGGGGWWFGDCSSGVTTGVPYRNFYVGIYSHTVLQDSKMRWATWQINDNIFRVISSATMKIRRSN